MTIIRCPQCGQQFRVPDDRGELVVRCPECRHSWSWTPPDYVQVGLQIAKALSIKVHREMFEQYLHYRMGVRQEYARTCWTCRGPVRESTVREWVRPYERDVNQMGER